MGIAEHWDELEGSWDRLGLGETNPLPGIWRITGSAGRQLDIKPRPNQDTAKIKNKGYKNAELTLTGEMTTVAELNALARALDKIHPRRKGKGDSAHAITHPSTALIGVRFVMVRTIHTAELDNGILTQRIDVIEFVPKPKKKKKGPVKITQAVLDGIIEATSAFGSFESPAEAPPSNFVQDFIILDSLP